jgi:plastocyanin
MRISQLLCVFVLAATAACGSSSPAGSTGKHLDPATAATISGRVVFEGTPPKVEPIKMSSDPACVQAGPTGAPMSDSVLVGKSGEVQNAFVYVKDGLDPTYTFDTPATPVVLEQKGCRYVPRILGIRAGQSLEVVNQDAIFHNVHALPKNNQEFNQGEPVQGMRMTHVFTTPEAMVRFTCNVHSWMTAYVGVMAHPFFAVTGADGSFEIKGLPPGTYTIEAWHEKFGAETHQVTIGPHATQSVAFSFAAKG